MARNQKLWFLHFEIENKSGMVIDFDYVMTFNYIFEKKKHEVLLERFCTAVKCLSLLLMFAVAVWSDIANRGDILQRHKLLVIALIFREVLFSEFIFKEDLGRLWTRRLFSTPWILF